MFVQNTCDEGGEPAGRRADGGVHADEADGGVERAGAAEPTARVEALEAEPQDEGAERDQPCVVRAELRLVLVHLALRVRVAARY